MLVLLTYLVSVLTDDEAVQCVTFKEPLCAANIAEKLLNELVINVVDAANTAVNNYC